MARTRNYIPVRLRWQGPAADDEVLVHLDRLEGDHVVGRWADPSENGG